MDRSGGTRVLILDSPLLHNQSPNRINSIRQNEDCTLSTSKHPPPEQALSSTQKRDLCRFAVNVALM
jgi:hypothetical protein